MKLRRNGGSNNNGLPTGGGISQPSLNKTKNSGKIVLVAVVLVAMIAWVLSIGRKAEETVSVCMLKEPMYKNEVLTEDLLMEYQMLRGEFEKYSIKNNAGVVTQRLVRWEDRGQVLNAFAAYPLQRETLLEYRSLVKSRTDNTDSVLYSFPGKEIVQLDIAGSDLNSFKTFLRPGDRINVDAIYSEKVTVQTDDGYGGTVNNEVEVFKTEPVFNSIMIADIINSSGASVLDIYESYNEMTAFQQSQLDASASFAEQTEPKSLLVALTPDEKESYYRFLSKSNIEFKVSLPQRME